MSPTPPTDAVEIGTFAKIASPHVIELLGLSGLDFAVIDAEHAPIGIDQIDLLMLAGRAVGLPLCVRVPDQLPATLLRVLDTGAAGVLVPHVDSAEQAAAVVGACRYRRGTRGYSGSTRFAGYGTQGMRATLDAADDVLVMCQIESVQAVQACADIAATPGVDGVFVGRADLALSMGLESAQAPEVLAATQTVIRAGLAHGKRVGVLVNSLDEREAYARQGVTWFIQGSDQGLLLQGARSLVPAHR
ncbi:aldolase [Verticiella sediminum]|uniref:Aldolase n=1 Tax=Verticiella sediminum TaxID=1247510 RepID=A0A556AJ53_9BURK|nr:aldolase/citrate lyase family protein [Verticiella sediminum]TSH92932.1 aldolase [Verticiella sediminum]